LENIESGKAESAWWWCDNRRDRKHGPGAKKCGLTRCGV